MLIGGCKENKEMTLSEVFFLLFSRCVFDSYRERKRERKKERKRLSPGRLAKEKSKHSRDHVQRTTDESRERFTSALRESSCITDANEH